MYNYVTLEAVKRYIGGSIGTDDDETLLEMIDWSSRLIEAHKGRRYDVRLETRRYDTPEIPSSAFGAYDGRYPLVLPEEPPLRLDEDLLEVISLVNGDGEELTTDAYVLRPNNASPKSRIQLRSGTTWLDADAGPEQSIQVTGLWGYHDRYAEAWCLSGVNAGEIAAEDLTITLSAMGTFQVGHLVRIDDEFLLVSAVDTAEKTIEVERAVNGTAAAAHTSANDLYIYRPMGTIVQMATRLVKWRYAQKSVDAFDRTYVAGTGIVTTPTSLPADVERILGPRRVRL